MILNPDTPNENPPTDAPYGYGKFLPVYQSVGIPVPEGGRLFPFRVLHRMEITHDDLGETRELLFPGSLATPVDSRFQSLLQERLEPYGGDANTLLDQMGSQMGCERFVPRILVFFPWDLDIAEESLEARGPDRDRVAFGQYGRGLESLRAVGFLAARSLNDLKDLAGSLPWLKPVVDCLGPISPKQKVAFFPDSTFPLPLRFEEEPVAVPQKTGEGS